MPYHFSSIKAHCRNKIDKVDKRQIAHFLLFLSGIGILIWQIWNTFQGFIEGQTSFSTSQQTFEVLEPPGMILCPKNIWSGYSNTIFSNKDWDSKHFLKLNDSLTLIFIRWKGTESTSHKLILGENFDEISKTFFIEKLITPYYGMCYALMPNQNYKMSIKDRFIIKVEVAIKEKMPPFDVYFIHEEDRYEFLMADLGQLGDGMDLEVVESGSWYNFRVRKIMWSYLPSKRNCKNYGKDDSYTKCILKNQVDCYIKNGPSRGCNCVAENIFPIHFEFHSITFWNSCKTQSEYMNCFWTMNDCYYNKMERDAWRNLCPLPCQKVVYKAQCTKQRNYPSSNNNGISFFIGHGTMNMEKNDEVWIMETYNFIGTVGGSLGLFIGFSYTGFFGHILDCLFFRYVKN